MLHADGKKHRAKARAYHAAQQPPKQSEEVIDLNGSTEQTSNCQATDSNNVEEPEPQNLPKVDIAHEEVRTLNGDLPSSKKRKINACENDGKKTSSPQADEGGAGEVIQVDAAKTKEAEKQCKKSKHALPKDSPSMNTDDSTEKKIKWKKMISSTLKSVCT